LNLRKHTGNKRELILKVLISAFTSTVGTWKIDQCIREDEKIITFSSNSMR